MLSTLLSICAIFPAAGAFQQPAMPHPSLPVRDHQGDYYLNEDLPGYGRWVALEPGWLSQENELKNDSRMALLQRVAASRGLDDAGTTAWVDATAAMPLVLNYRILSNGEEVLAGRESIPLGKAVALSDSRRLSEILDFDVEIASGAGILDPVIGQQYSGTSLALEALPVPGLGWQLEIALVHSTTAPGTLIDDGYAQMDGKMRLIEHIAECGLATVMKSGETASLELANLGPGKVVLEMQMEGAMPPASQQLADDLYFVTAPTLSRDRDWAKHSAVFEEQVLMWSNAQGYMVFEGENAQAVAASAAQTAAQLAQTIQLQLAVQTIRDGVEEAPANMRFAGLQNMPVVFAQGTVRDALVDWDVEVAQVSRVADPDFINLFSGARGELTSRIRADGKIEVDLDLTFVVVELGEPRQIRLAAAAGGETGYDGKVPASPAQVLSIETPEVGEMRFQGTYLADDSGRIVLVRSARSLLGEATRLRLVLQVDATR
mgnify:CR=1 FL=1